MSVIFHCFSLGAISFLLSHLIHSLSFVSENVNFLWVTTGKYRRCHRCVMNFILNSTAHKIGRYVLCVDCYDKFQTFILLKVLFQMWIE